MSRQMIGLYIVIDSNICHGKPTFRGTRIMVADVLDMVVKGLDWDTIVYQWHDSITKEAIAEAVNLAGQAFLKHADEFVVETISA